MNNEAVRIFSEKEPRTEKERGKRMITMKEEYQKYIRKELGLAK